jgi:C4-dicarboxylate transporter/malic acid transport protein
MGTGILASTSLFYSSYLSFLQYVAKALLYLNCLLFCLLLIPCLLRWLLYRENALRDLRHPVTSNFYPTLSVGLLVLASDFIVIGGPTSLSSYLWAAGAALTTLFSFIIPYVSFTGDHVTLDHINPAWFIPPVGLIVIPIAGSAFIGRFPGVANEMIIAINYFGWGAGFFLYLSLLAICMYRFVIHRPLPNVLAPTVWINLGPIGAGTVALFNLVTRCQFITQPEPFFVLGLLFWGFGIWWLVMAISITLHYVRRLRLPYAMSWWAFTFPLGAYVAATHMVAQRFSLGSLDYLGFGLYILLFVLWAVTATSTAYHVLGELFARSNPGGEA